MPPDLYALSRALSQRVDTRVLIVGDGEQAQLVEAKIRDAPELGYRVVGFIGNGSPAPLVHPVLGHLRDVPRVVREQGVAPAGAQRLRVYVSAEAHTWVQKATDLSGVGTEALRWIATDSRQRMDVWWRQRMGLPKTPTRCGGRTKRSTAT